MIQHFHVDGFRAFRGLRLSNLKAVNLIVGQNSAGKTTILEALRLYLSEDSWIQMAELLSSREEFSFKGRRKRDQSSIIDAPPLAFESLFFGRPQLDTNPAFTMGSGSRNNLEVRFSWLRRVEDEVDASVRYTPAHDSSSIKT